MNPNPGLDDLSPAALAWEIVNGLWRVTRRTDVDGQPTIELAETPAGHYQPLPTLLWVNAHIYLPLRMISGAGKTVVAQSEWHYLKPTTANLALLQVPIPADYPRSSPHRLTAPQDHGNLGRPASSHHAGRQRPRPPRTCRSRSTTWNAPVAES